MANIVICGANGYSTPAEAVATGKWDGSTWSGATPAGTTYGRFARGVRFGNSHFLQKNLPSQQSRVYMGAAIYVDTLDNGRLMQVQDAAGTVQCSLFLNNDGSLSMMRGGTTSLKSSAPGIISPLRWYYIEWSPLVSDTVGQFEVRVDGVTVLTEAGLASPIDTKASTVAGSTINTATFIVTGSFNANYTDMYVNDPTGTLCNTFMGDGRVDGKAVTANGATTDFTPSAGLNFQNVDDDPGNDGDATFNESNTAGHKDLFALANLPSLAGTIHAVGVACVGKKTDALSRFFRNLLRSGGTNYEGADVALSGTAYGGKQTIWMTDPATSAAWTATGVNNMQAGYKLQT